MKKDKTKNAHYIDNKEFLRAITEYREKVLSAKESGDEKPRVTNYLGECMVKIANHLAYKSNFVNYTFRDEMILDGIENCITYIDNFDPEKSKNPFAYFTQITYYAFLRRIQKEKKQMDTKNKYIQSLDIESIMNNVDPSDPNTGDYLDFLRKQVDEAGKLDAQHPTSNLVKRRPKYFDDAEAMKLAKEKVDKLKDLAD